ncbi:MAG TPA: NADH-quinone oxidoreductase subunit C [Streptosporangiaceae bacterium]|nr:NADH-quinone oxidoreductase subunit C [Streptosporangiaceae bacterium]
MTATVGAPASVIELTELLVSEAAAGRRFAGLMGTQVGDTVQLSAHVAGPDAIDTHDVMLPAGADGYPAMTPALSAAFWYERELHDQFGIVPYGHPRLEPLILPRGEHSVPRHVLGPGLFTIPHGPVRSGVMESVEYLVETPGEDIPHLNLRVFYKHRGIERRFGQLALDDGVLLAERTEGMASVAHALAYCHALERIAGLGEVPRLAALTRVLHAELERIVAHLDVALRLADAAGLAVATARFGLHKERVMRLVGRMCGSRFGRGVVVPGGVRCLPQIPAAELLNQVARIEREVTADSRALMGTASFLDRLRRTGPLTPERAAEHGALGPIGKASGYSDDARVARPYDAYRWLTRGRQPEYRHGDALARLRVRWDEVTQSFGLLRQAAERLADAADSPLRAEIAADIAAGALSGRATGWAEAPHGEVLYDLAIHAGRITRCRPRSPSFHNLVLFHEVFAGDILTDFPFIEASFGLSVAGVAL